MGFWDVLDFLETEDKFYTAKEIMDELRISYNSVNKHLRKLVSLGYIVFIDNIKQLKNYKIPYKVYKAKKFIK